MAELDWRESLQAKNVTLIPGVGPERAARLKDLGIQNAYDLLYYFPYRYEQISENFSRENNLEVNTVFVVDSEVSVQIRGRKSTLRVWVKNGNERVQALFFNQPYLRHQLKAGVILRIKGKFAASGQTLMVSKYEILKANETSPDLISVYRGSNALGSLALRKIIWEGVKSFSSLVGEDLPSEIRDKFRLIVLSKAIQDMHCPKNTEEIRQSRRRLVFEEFLRFQLEVQGYRRSRHQVKQHPLSQEELLAIAENFIGTLPFSPTDGQRVALVEILKDLANDIPMHRLLHGEVGAGKTWVVFAAVAALAKSGYQSALMVPTSLLAWQHVQTASLWLEPFGVRVGFLSGFQTSGERDQLFSKIANGEVDFIIGTQILTRSDLLFSNLRLVIFDEQHRFGVQSRKLLRQKGELTDVLQLTATPIPRTYALTMYGDVGITSLRELPPGRKPVLTYLVDPREELKVLRWLRRELAKGRQVFVVAPRIDPPDDELEVDYSAITLFSKFEEELAGFQIGLVHGNQTEAHRMSVMKNFSEGDLQVLIATTIIEVGINVPNATAILIYGGERFGLATLHQLRGRVGRSTHTGRCIVIANTDSDYAKARLEAFLESNDGFELAEKDLRLRGPGEAFGDRQSGLPMFQVGDVIRDIKVMEVARTVVKEWLESEDFWLLPSYYPLRKVVQELEDWHRDA